MNRPPQSDAMKARVSASLKKYHRKRKAAQAATVRAKKRRLARVAA